jgi:hypothetical protein
MEIRLINTKTARCLRLAAQALIERKSWREIAIARGCIFFCQSEIGQPAVWGFVVIHFVSIQRRLLFFHAEQFGQKISTNSIKSSPNEPKVIGY